MDNDKIKLNNTDLCSICLDNVMLDNHMTHCADDCRCTIKKNYCIECLLKWYEYKGIVCPICREGLKNHDYDIYDLYSDENLDDIELEELYTKWLLYFSTGVQIICISLFFISSKYLINIIF
jgi:hypothetical protein